MYRRTLTFSTPGRGAHRIGPQVRDALREAGIETGLCHLFLQHTSAGLMIMENADPDVLRDIELWLSTHVLDGDPRYAHTDEGPDDMSAHIRTLLTETSLWVPVEHGRLALGTWQGLYLFEHRTSPHRRRVVVTVLHD